ncbi:MAG: cobalamin B12-binding domain-containing protein [Pseudomonadota bacterium]|nr:cobalamin B12-binding domain-containing protein [Pseudomonadota bacterium]
MHIGDYAEQGGGGSVWEGNGARPSKDETTEESLRMARLVRTIEGEIVPRLVLARRVSGSLETVKATECKPPDCADIRELVRLLLAHDAGVASAYVEAVRQRGATHEIICLQLLAPAARELGLMWEQDECDFMQVTVGLCRLHQVLRELSSEFSANEGESLSGRRVLLAPVPGEQHTFGITLVAQFLRRAGWEVWHEFPTNRSDIIEILRQNWFTVVGLSVARDSSVGELSKIISSIRQFSRNPSVGVLIGGPLLVSKPEIADAVGADATAADGNEAVQKAQLLCDRRAGRSVSN